MVADNLARLGPTTTKSEEQGVKDQRIQRHTHNSPRLGARGDAQLHISQQHSKQP
ncbi:hypothetical protein DPMN_178804 [Dreissena polymorpha]|uniref:Uncharacterized protein n=1 Tax=Dreissena polymorpha TaxID=45954 RepID=A0A9D4IMY4_DREPO|nr:hypothetical protein DPMN_178804 [Dreissena polymorpha]